MGEDLANTLLNGSIWAGIPIALLAGLVSFVSPCVLPLLPGYFAYVSGFADEQPGDGQQRQATKSRLMLGVTLFVLGFSVPFVLFGVAFGALGAWLHVYGDLIMRGLGAVLIVMGFVFIGQVRLFQRTLRPSLKPKVGLAGAPLLGLVFGIGWTPCMGPVLAAINTLSLGTGSPLQGGLLAFFFCLGLGIPFVIAAAGFGWATRTIGWARRHVRLINVLGGVMLIVLGILLLTGLWGRWIDSLQGVITGFETII